MASLVGSISSDLNYTTFDARHTEIWNIGGDLYTIMHCFSPLRVDVYKSTDGGANWTIFQGPLTHNIFSWGFNHAVHYPGTTIIHVLYGRDSKTSSPGAPTYARFDTSTDTWTLTGDAGAPTLNNDEGNLNAMMSVRSNGDVYAIYQSQSRDMGNDINEMLVAKRTDAGTWSLLRQDIGSWSTDLVLRHSVSERIYFIGRGGAMTIVEPNDTVSARIPSASGNVNYYVMAGGWDPVTGDAMVLIGTNSNFSGTTFIESFADAASPSPATIESISNIIYEQYDQRGTKSDILFTNLGVSCMALGEDALTMIAHFFKDGSVWLQSEVLTNTGNRGWSIIPISEVGNTATYGMVLFDTASGVDYYTFDILTGGEPENFTAIQVGDAIQLDWTSPDTEFVVERQEQTLIDEYVSQGSISKPAIAPPYLLTYAGEDIWSIRYDPDITERILQKYDLDAGAYIGPQHVMTFLPYDIAWDGDHLLIVTSENEGAGTDNQCRRMDVSDFSIVNTFTIHTSSQIAKGVASDGTYVWVHVGPRSSPDSQSSIRRYTKAGTYESQATIAAQNTTGPTVFWRRLEYGGGKLWCVRHWSSSSSGAILRMEPFSPATYDSFGLASSVFWSTIIYRESNGWAYVPDPNSTNMLRYSFTTIAWGSDATFSGVLQTEYLDAAVVLGEYRYRVRGDNPATLWSPYVEVSFVPDTSITLDGQVAEATSSGLVAEVVGFLANEALLFSIEPGETIAQGIQGTIEGIKLDPPYLLLSVTESGVQLDWTASPDPRVFEYLAFRRSPPTGAPFDPDVDTPIATVETTGHFDLAPPAGQYEYQVFGNFNPGVIVIDGSQANSVTAQGTATGNYPSLAEEGDILLAIYVRDLAGDTSPGELPVSTPPSGWELLTSHQDASNIRVTGGIEAWAKIAGPSEPSSYAWTNDPAIFSLTILAIRFVDASAPLATSIITSIESATPGVLISDFDVYELGTTLENDPDDNAITIPAGYSGGLDDVNNYVYAVQSSAFARYDTSVRTPGAKWPILRHWRISTWESDSLSGYGRSMTIDPDGNLWIIEVNYTFGEPYDYQYLRRYDPTNLPATDGDVASSTRSLVPPSTRPVDLTFDGDGNLWVIDYNAGLYKLNQVSGAVIDHYPNLNGHGVAWDGTHILVSLATSPQSVIKMDIVTEEIIFDGFDLPRPLGPEVFSFSRGIHWDGTDLWFFDGTHQYANRRWVRCTISPREPSQVITDRPEPGNPYVLLVAAKVNRPGLSTAPAGYMEDQSDAISDGIGNALNVSILVNPSDGTSPIETTWDGDGGNATLFAVAVSLRYSGG